MHQELSGEYLTSLQEIMENEKAKALRMFGPGEMILAHVHDGKERSADSMVVWLPPEGFGR